MLSMTPPICDTADVAYQPSEKLLAAQKAVEEAKAAAKKLIDDATAELNAAIAEEVTGAPTVTDVANHLGWSVGYVRRIARAKGVPPRVDVEPPRRRRSASSGDQ